MRPTGRPTGPGAAGGSGGSGGRPAAPAGQPQRPGNSNSSNPDKRAREVWEQQQQASRAAAESKAEAAILKPDFTASTSDEAGAIKQRLSSDADFKQAVTSWDNRRKRIEARLDSCDGKPHHHSS